MKDIGEVAYILGVKISTNISNKLVSLLQEPYIQKILKLCRMQDCKPIDTPTVKGEILSHRLCPKTSEEKE